MWKRLQSGFGLTDEKYSAHTLERVLGEYLGETRLGELLKPCLVTAYDITRREARFFNSADVATKKLGPSRDFYVRDVARATSAAPTYFEPANIAAMDRSVYSLVDGGVFANNPTMCACVEAFSLQPKLQVTDLTVLSLGTGQEDKPYHYSEAKGWGQVEWIHPVIGIMMSGVAETVDYELRMLFQSAGCPDNYLRLQVDLQKFPQVDGTMDHASEKNMRALEEVGRIVAEENDAKLEAMAERLMAD